MAITRATPDQILFHSAETGDHVLDDYLEAVERGGKTIAQLFDEIYDASGNINANFIEIRVDPTTDYLQYRVGQFVDPEAGWVNSNTKLLHAAGAWQINTPYYKSDIVTYNNGTYLCILSHTSTTSFDPNKWQGFFDPQFIQDQVTLAQQAANNASVYKDNASASATAAANSEASASGYATSAQNSATNASASASAAQTSETNAAASESTASSAASTASTAATNAAAVYDAFDDRYLGAKSSDPALDNDGNALASGTLYFNTTAGEMRHYNGSIWQTAYLPAAAYLEDSDIGVTVQAYDADLAAVAALATNGFASKTGAGTWAIISDPLPISNGGTGATTTGGAAGALDNLLPSGEVSGYVLKTSGSGTYYWGAESGSGSFGSTISSTVNIFTATASQTLFSGLPTYVIGAYQVNVYINGVLQHTDQYTETSTTSITLSTGATVGDKVMIKIDRATGYAPAASDVSFLPGGNLSSTTVQAALGELDSEKAPVTTGSAILYGNGTGGFSSVTIGAGLTFSAGTLSGQSFAAGTTLPFYQQNAPTGWTKVVTNNDIGMRIVSGTTGGTATTAGRTAFSTVFASRTPAGTLSTTAATGTTDATTLTAAQSGVPAHSHTASDGGHVHGVSDGGHGHGQRIQAGAGNAQTLINDVYSPSAASPFSQQFRATSAATSQGWQTITTSGAGTGIGITTGFASITVNNSAATNAASGHTHTFTATAHNHTFTGTAMDFAVSYLDLILASKD